jgi:tRNA A-37 threonylcarbamoyl transferase component Bud32
VSLQNGDNFDIYEILNKLGEGGMAEVYRVRNTVNDRIEALKIVRAEFAKDPMVQERARREARNQAALSHANIAPLYTARFVDGQLFIAMEYVEGESLAQALTRGPLTTAAATECMTQVLEALKYSHGKGIIHRDLKPSNIMLKPDGTAKLMDFGIAKTPYDSRLTPTNYVMGSPLYLAPEQFSGHPPDVRSDLYSLGVTLYELVTAKRPFTGDNAAVMYGHLEVNPKPPMEVVPGLPRELNDVILKAMAKDPERRYQTADEFREELVAVQATLAAAMEPSATLPRWVASASRRGYRFCRAALAAFLGSAFIALLIVCGSVGPIVYHIEQKWIRTAGGHDDLVMVAIFLQAILLMGLGYVGLRWFWRAGDDWLAGRLLSFKIGLTQTGMDIFKAHHSQTFAIIQERRNGDLEWDPDGSKPGPRLIPLPGREIPSGRGTGQTRARSRRTEFDDVSKFLRVELLRSDEPVYMITGEPGSGKSTLLFELFRQCSYHVRECGTGWIPLLIFGNELEYLTLCESEDLCELLGRYFEAKRQPRLKKWIQECYDTQRLLIIIDGLDEFQDLARYTQAVQKLGELVLKNPGHHRIILSCREEDYQGRIPGRLFCVLPLVRSQIERYLKQSEAYLRSIGREKKANEFRRALTGLHQSRIARLLQNYMGNPYLLTLIVEYYKQSAEPLAKTLAPVFERVLGRELEKSPERGQETQDQIKLLASVVPPYCYRKTTTDVMGGASREQGDAVSAYLQSDPDLKRLLFDDEGYLKAKHCGRGVERPYYALAELWGRGPAEEWSTRLDEILTEQPPYGEFVSRGLNMLDEIVCRTLSLSNLAQISEDRIVRMRHRRMQHYFLALFWDRVGTARCPEVVALAGDAWFCEAFRLFAAVASRPKELLQMFLEEFDRARLAERGDLDLAVRILHNASEAVAYLPSSTPIYEPRTILEGIRELGRRAEELLHHFLASDTLDAGTTSQGGNLIPKKRCFDALCNTYGSEVLATTKDEAFLSSLFDSELDLGEGKTVNYWVWLHRKLLSTAYYLQELAYSSLYSIRSKQRDFPISHVGVFLYVIDSVLLFEGAYKRNIEATHERESSRVAVRTAVYLERALCLVGALSISTMAVQAFRGYFLLSLVASSAIAVACLYAMAKAYQTGWIPTPSESYQLPIYWLLWNTKRLSGRLIWVMYGSAAGHYAIGVHPKPMNASAMSAGSERYVGVLSRLRVAVLGEPAPPRVVLPAGPVLIEAPGPAVVAALVLRPAVRPSAWYVLRMAAGRALLVVSLAGAGLMVYVHAPYWAEESRMSSDDDRITALEANVRTRNEKARTMAAKAAGVAIDEGLHAIRTDQSTIAAILSAVEVRQKAAVENQNSLLIGPRWVDVGLRMREQQDRLKLISGELVNSEGLLQARKEQLAAKARADEFFSESLKLREDIRQALPHRQRDAGSLAQLTSRCSTVENAGRLIDGRTVGPGQTVNARTERDGLGKECLEVQAAVDVLQTAERIADFLRGSKAEIADSHQVLGRHSKGSDQETLRRRVEELSAADRALLAWLETGRKLQLTTPPQSAEVARMQSQLTQARNDVAGSLTDTAQRLDTLAAKDRAETFLKSADELLTRLRPVTRPPTPMTPEQSQTTLQSFEELQSSTAGVLETGSELDRRNDLSGPISIAVRAKLEAVRNAERDLQSWRGRAMAEAETLARVAQRETAIQAARNTLKDLPPPGKLTCYGEACAPLQAAADQAIQQLRPFEDPETQRLTAQLTQRGGAVAKRRLAARATVTAPVGGSPAQRRSVPVSYTPPAPRAPSPEELERQARRREESLFTQRLDEMDQRTATAAWQKRLGEIKQQYEPIVAKLRSGQTGVANASDGIFAFLVVLQLEAARKDVVALRTLEADLPGLEQDVAASQADIQSLDNEIAARLRSSPPLERARLSATSVAAERERLQKLRADLAALNLTRFDQELGQTIQRSKDRSQSQLQYFLGVVALLTIVGFARRLFRSKGADSGRSEVWRVRENFDNLLNFLATAGYTWPVHEEAIAFLRAALPTNPSALRAVRARDRIAEVAERRLHRAGDVNLRIGRALLQVAQEVDHILNRQTVGQ